MGKYKLKNEKYYHLIKHGRCDPPQKEGALYGSEGNGQQLAPDGTEPMARSDAESPRSSPQTSNIFLRSQDENTTYINTSALLP